MKKADLIVGVILVIFSSYLMWKSMELPIGWLKGAGPGGGAFPFWLSLIMLVTSVLVVGRNLLKKSGEGLSTAIFMDKDAVHLFMVVLISLGALIALVDIIGIYFAMPLFLAFYLRYLGKHHWGVTLGVSLSTPVLIFILFEKVLVILLPKGYAEPLFLIFY